MFFNCLILKIINRQIIIYLKNSLPLLLLAFTTTLFAQGRKPLNGKVISDFDALDGIYIINKSTEHAVTTSQGGYFTIEAQPCDTLVISAVQFAPKSVAMTEEHFEVSLLIVPLEIQSRELRELIIGDYSHINAESLGLVPAGQTQYTPAEKKLATASKFRMNPMGLDPIINMFSGRTAMLKKAAETEKQEDLMEKIHYIYTAQDIMDQFKIPADYVRGFVFYIVENKYFANAINTKNDNMAKFLMAGLATKYLDLIKGNE